MQLLACRRRLSCLVYRFPQNRQECIAAVGTIGVTSAEFWVESGGLSSDVGGVATVCSGAGGPVREEEFVHWVCVKEH